MGRHSSLGDDHLYWTLKCNDEEWTCAHKEMGEDGSCGHSGIKKETDPDWTNEASVVPYEGKDMTIPWYTGWEDGETLLEEIDPLGTLAPSSERIYGGSDDPYGADSFAPSESLLEEIREWCTCRNCDENVVSLPTRCAAESE